MLISFVGRQIRCEEGARPRWDGQVYRDVRLSGSPADGQSRRHMRGRRPSPQNVARRPEGTLSTSCSFPTQDANTPRCAQHILTFPIDGGSTLNMVAFVSDRSKPESERTFHGAWVTPSSLGEMQKDYQGWDRMVTNLFPVSPRRGIQERRKG